LEKAATAAFRKSSEVRTYGQCENLKVVSLTFILSTQRRRRKV
jgi:hypothetical protein